MNRRRFLIGTAAAAGAKVIDHRAAFAEKLSEKNTANSITPTEGIIDGIFVSPEGDDTSPGSETQPLRSFASAQRMARARKAQAPGAIFVFFRAGIYYLPETIVFTAKDSGTPEAPVIYRSYPGEQAVLSGGLPLHLQWEPYRDGILQARVPEGTKTDQLFVNGQRQILARYPNYDESAGPLNGTSPDAFSRERAKRWTDPRGGYIHAMHKSLWGDQWYAITGKDKAGNITYVGGWQNNRPAPMHEQYRYVENIFEELDSPGEWFLNHRTLTLYYYPPHDVDLKTARVETVRLKHLVEFRGTADHPVRGIELRGFIFRHSARTFMETREPLLRSDWRIYRGGAIFLDGAEDCGFQECFFDQLGGNAIFVSSYNRRIAISRCHIAEAGASGVCFVGNPDAVRNPLFAYEDRLNANDIDRTPGPRTGNYPKDCIVEDSLIQRTGRFEKQTAPVEISMSESITVSRCSIYDVPRAGINIGDGCWGGHRIEFCDVFDTVMETGDHGSFNSWGRDRWWGLKGVDLDTAVSNGDRELPILDAMRPNILCNSRWSCEHGWDIDLDDGSSNYQIYNNLCLNGGIELREGFDRTCRNNITVRDTLHPHVWYLDSEDVVLNNILFLPYRPIQMRKWTKEIDFNLLHRAGVEPAVPALELQQLSGEDQHSLAGDAQFINSHGGDYRVKADSPALRVGFVNFEMNSFGVQTPALRAIARQPELNNTQRPTTLGEHRSQQTALWMGATVRNLVGMDEVSVTGAPGETGVLVIALPFTSAAAYAGLENGDLILAFNQNPVDTLANLLKDSGKLEKGQSVTLTVLRHQHRIGIRVTP